MGLAVLAGVTDPRAPEPGWSAEAVAFLVGSAAVAVRGPSLGVVVTPEHVELRNFLRKRVIPRVEIVDVRVANYDGMLAWGTPGGVLGLQVIDVRVRGGGSYKTFGVMGTTRGTKARAESLRLALGLGPAEPPRHRRDAPD